MYCKGFLFSFKEHQDLIAMENIFFNLYASNNHTNRNMAK